jgi:hypothetical protein
MTFINPETGLPDPVTFHTGGLRFTHLTSPDESGGYSIAVPWSDLPEVLLDVCAESVMRAKSSTWGLVNFRTQIPPMLHGMDADNADLIALRQRLDATNIALERLLVDQLTQVSITFWRKRSGAQGSATGDQIGTSLNAIQFDPGKLKFPAFGEELLYKKKWAPVWT